MRMNRNWRRALLATAAACALPGIAEAQSAPAGAKVRPAPAATEGYGDEIVVTARKREESLQDVPISVQAFSSAELERSGIKDFSEIAYRVPGLKLSAERAVDTELFIRGIGSDIQGAGADGAVGIFLDGAYLSRGTGSLLDLYDLERVEVLKGPQGTLYGRNTTAGLINFITAKPTDSFEGNIKADLGNYQTYNIGGHISGLQRLKPAPRTARPGVAPLCSPFRNTPTPLTKTSRIPTEYWCGFSKVDRSPIVAGSNTTTSA